MKNKTLYLRKMTALFFFSSFFLSTLSYAEQDSKESYKNFSECAAIRMKEVNLEKLKRNPKKLTTKIPEGWTVVSGSGGEGHPKLLICR